MIHVKQSGFRFAPPILARRLGAWNVFGLAFDREAGAHGVELLLELLFDVFDGSRAGFVHDCFSKEVNSYCFAKGLKGTKPYRLFACSCRQAHQTIEHKVTVEARRKR